jgi:hypothetical protein
MPQDKSIFGLRFGSNAQLLPTLEELRAFLTSPKKDGNRELHSGDLASYNEMLDRIKTFEQNRLRDLAHEDIRERMFYDTLRHTSFFNPSLKAEIAQYKYHCNALLSLDFRKPAAFIMSVEEEMGKLNPKKKDEAIKLGRLQGMAEERKQTIKTLRLRRAMLAEELSNIALYVQINLIKIEKLCEGSIVVLVDFHLTRMEESRLIEDLKKQFKEQLRDSLHNGLLTKEHLETVKKDVDTLSKEIVALLRDDVYALTGLLEAVHDHAKKFADEINDLTARIVNGGDVSLETQGKLYEQIGHVLVRLVSDYRFDLKMAAIHTATGYEDILIEKRKEMLDRLFALLLQERRSWGYRRTIEDRRKFINSSYKYPERRRRKSRRSGKNRRFWMRPPYS